MRYTRQEIAKILSDIAPKGEKLQEKVEAIRALNLRSTQGIDVADTLAMYEEF